MDLYDSSMFQLPPLQPSGIPTAQANNQQQIEGPKVRLPQLGILQDCPGAGSWQEQDLKVDHFKKLMLHHTRKRPQQSNEGEPPKFPRCASTAHKAATRQPPFTEHAPLLVEDHG